MNASLPLRLVALACALVPGLGAAAARNVDEKHAADPQGTVEVSNVAGRLEIQGWDRPEVAVTGTLGAGVERLDFTTTGNRTEVRVVLPKIHFGISDGEARLVVRVPARSEVNANVVSADLVARGVTGRLALQSVSGEVEAEVAREARINTVSGDATLAARPETALLEIRTVSGGVVVRGGPRGEVSVATVSGDAELALGPVNRARFKTVSGDLAAELGLAADARVEAESVSGDVKLTFGGTPSGRFDVETLSGDIDNCFGPKPTQPRFGPGSRLSFQEGTGHAEVRIDTKSGDVSLCTGH
jgi:DUF4097 and DUF4098 domain-containing protein YvlB